MPLQILDDSRGYFETEDQYINNNLNAFISHLLHRHRNQYLADYIISKLNIEMINKLVYNIQRKNCVPGVDMFMHSL